VKSSQSIISTGSRLLAVVQILLSTVNSHHLSNCCYAVVTNTDFFPDKSRGEFFVIRAAANESSTRSSSLASTQVPINTGST